MAEKRSTKRPKKKKTGSGNPGWKETLAVLGGGTVASGALGVGSHFIIEEPGLRRAAQAAINARQATAGRAAAEAVRQAGSGRVTSGPLTGTTRLSGGARFPPSTYTPTEIPTQQSLIPTARPAPVIPETPVTLGNRPIPSTELVPYKGQNFEFAPRQSGYTGGNPGVLSGEPLGARMSGDPLLFGGRPSNAVSAAQNAGGIPETPVSLSNRIPETPVSLSNRIPETPVSIRPTPAPVPGTDLVPYKGQPNWEFGSKAGTPPSGGTGSVGPAASIADDVAAGAGAEGAAATGARGVFQAMKAGGVKPMLLDAGMGSTAAGALTMAGGVGAGLLAQYGVDKINIGGENSYLDKGLSSAAGGAASGAVFGGGYGALAGGLIGGALGVGSKYFGDKAAPAQQAQGTFQEYSAFGAQYGVPQNTMYQLGQQYQAALDLGKIANGTDEAGMAASEASALQSYSTAVATAVQGQLSGPSQAAGDANNAALQAVMTQYIQPYADQQIGSSMAYADQLEKYAGQNPSLSAILRNQAAAERANGTRMAASLMTSARIEPYMQAAQNQQTSLAQQSQQIAAQAMQPQAAASASPATM